MDLKQDEGQDSLTCMRAHVHWLHGSHNGEADSTASHQPKCNPQNDSAITVLQRMTDFISDLVPSSLSPRRGRFRYRERYVRLGLSREIKSLTKVWCDIGKNIRGPTETIVVSAKSIA